MTVESKSSPKTILSWRTLLRFLIALVGLFGCYRLSADSLNAGASRLMSAFAIVQYRIEPADAAVRFAPRDPEAHYTRGLTLINLGRLSEGVSEIQQAARLRPRHYYEWLDLGVTLDRLGDQAAGEAALRESIRLAPSFAQPRWQLGNVLFREGRFDEAFAELRLAARSNVKLFEGTLDLAWAASNGDVAATEAFVKAEGARNHFEFARFFAVQGMWADAARHATYAGEPQDEEERAFLRQTITRLLAAKKFSEAYIAWAPTHPTSPGGDPTDRLLNGDFTGPIMQNDPGFGWQLTSVPNVSVSIDPAGPTPNAQSIRFQFSGDNPTGSLLLSQLIQVRPNTRYSLEFMARAEKLVSGGPPVIAVIDGNSEERKLLQQSQLLDSKTNDWASFKLEFSTDSNTSTVIIGLQRVACNQVPCPIFGALSLSRFSLAKV